MTGLSGQVVWVAAIESPFDSTTHPFSTRDAALAWLRTAISATEWEQAAAGLTQTADGLPVPAFDGDVHEVLRFWFGPCQVTAAPPGHPGAEGIEYGVGLENLASVNAVVIDAPPTLTPDA